MSSSAKLRLKSSFKVAQSYEPIHTGGKVALSGDGSWLISTLNDQALVTETAIGYRVKELAGDSSAVTTLSVTPSPLSPESGGYLLTCNRSLALHIYSLPSLELHRSIPKAHEAPIITCAADPTGTLFATGSADGIVKVWDASKAHCTHVLKGHGGVISALHFDIRSGDSNQSGISQGRARLVSGADDCRIRVWDLRTRVCLHELDSHVSVIRGLCVSRDGKTLASGSRDQVVNIWDLESGLLKRTMPVFETLEVIGLVDLNDTETDVKARGKGKAKAKDEEPRQAIFTAGDKGVIRLWDLTTGKIIDGERIISEKAKVHEILDVLYTPSKASLTAIYVDQNIVTRSLPTLEVTQQIIGFNDEIIDTTFVRAFDPTTVTVSATQAAPSSPDTHLAVATNSDLIRIYDLSSFDTILLEGHSDVVLCLARSTDGQILISGSKDKTARVWKMSRPSTAGKRPVWECIGVAGGHIESVGAVAASRRDRAFIVTGSQDRTVKIWDLHALLPSASVSAKSSRILTLTSIDSDTDTIVAARALSTLKIHDKDINSLDVSPNDKLLASGSQDRTAKLFAIHYTTATKASPATASLTPLGTFKGHKRGIWSVKFSPADQCLATASGDRTIKLWSLTDFTCLKTFEGHSNSVLRVDFLTRGMQLVSCASDGLVKVWNVKDEECAATLDNHEEKVWAIAVGGDESKVVSGGADSVLTVWEDVTEAEALERVAMHEEQVIKEQDFENYLSIKDYSNAILLALTMNQPRRLLKLFTEVRSATSERLKSITGSPHVDEVIKMMAPSDLRQLLNYVKDWNTVARTAEVAQGVLHAIIKYHSVEKLLSSLEAPARQAEDDATADDDDEDEEVARSRKNLARKKRKTDVKAADVLNALIPYTERHFSRADKIVRESFIVEHLLGMMESLEGEMDTGGAAARIGR